TGNLRCDFSIRTKDEFQSLAQSLKGLATTFNQKHKDIKQGVEALEQYAYRNLELKNDEKLMELIKSIKNPVEYFKS
ncbi:MAG: hypothetical protein HQL25_02310, partial [Candidatus Omnitrophica bacterium]|nr:hypothetical protein [Candidatus Omnitrophota bacterium]